MNEGDEIEKAKQLWDEVMRGSETHVPTAAQLIADVLHDPSEGIITLGTQGQVFTRWQRFRMWFWWLLGNKSRAQAIIIDRLAKK